MQRKKGKGEREKEKTKSLVHFHSLAICAGADIARETASRAFRRWRLLRWLFLRPCTRSSRFAERQNSRRNNQRASQRASSRSSRSSRNRNRNRGISQSIDEGRSFCVPPCFSILPFAAPVCRLPLFSKARLNLLFPSLSLLISLRCAQSSSPPPRSHGQVCVGASVQTKEFGSSWRGGAFSGLFDVHSVGLSKTDPSVSALGDAKEREAPQEARS